jgi:hypothetical protein
MLEGMFYKGQLLAWGLTLAVEGGVAALLAREFGLKPWRAAMAAVLGSLLSHPFVWWMFFQLHDSIGYWPTFVVAETFAVLVEAPFYRLAGASWSNAVTISFLVNAASVIVGFVVL